MGFFLVGQFFMNPFFLLGSLHLCARDENDMTYLGTFFASTVALTTTIMMNLGLSTQLSTGELALATGAAFFGITWVFVFWLAKTSFFRGFVAVILFFGYKTILDVLIFVFFIAPVVEGAAK